MTIIEGGTTQSERTRVGVIGEIRYDFSNDSIRLHNGEKVGGFEFLNRDVLDSRYAVATQDLLALSNPGDNSLGFVSRLGKGSYAYRNLEAAEGQLTLQYPNGSGGNPRFGLAATITSTHAFSAEITFTQAIQGDLEGSVTGNLTGNVTGDLTGDSTGTHTGPTIGSLDARGESVQLDDATLPISAISGLQAALNGLVFNLPTGLIVMWGGAVSAIPSGWALCDGQGGTPDLRDRFILGAGGAKAVGAVGGSNQHTHTTTIDAAGAHVHSVTVDGHALTESQIPAHKHGNGVTDSGSPAGIFNHGQFGANPSTPDSVDNNEGNGIYEGWTTTVGGGQEHTHTATSESAGNHTHAAETEVADNTPPFFALCYIIFTG